MAAASRQTWESCKESCSISAKKRRHQSRGTNLATISRSAFHGLINLAIFAPGRALQILLYLDLPRELCSRCMHTPPAQHCLTLTPCDILRWWRRMTTPTCSRLGLSAGHLKCVSGAQVQSSTSQPCSCSSTSPARICTTDVMQSESMLV